MERPVIDNTEVHMSTVEKAVHWRTRKKDGSIPPWGFSQVGEKCPKIWWEKKS